MGTTADSRSPAELEVDGWSELVPMLMTFGIQ